MTRLYNDPSHFADEAIDTGRRVRGGLRARLGNRSGRASTRRAHPRCDRRDPGSRRRFLSDLRRKCTTWAAEPARSGVDGLFLGRFAHDPMALAAVVDEAEALTASVNRAAP